MEPPVFSYDRQRHDNMEGHKTKGLNRSDSYHMLLDAPHEVMVCKEQDARGSVGCFAGAMGLGKGPWISSAGPLIKEHVPLGARASDATSGGRSGAALRSPTSGFPSAEDATTSAGPSSASVDGRWRLCHLNGQLGARDKPGALPPDAASPYRSGASLASWNEPKEETETCSDLDVDLEEGPLDAGTGATHPRSRERTLQETRHGKRRCEEPPAAESKERAFIAESIAL